MVAPAGSGKTQTIINRVLARIQAGMRPSRVLVLTFDNSAAQAGAGATEGCNQSGTLYCPNDLVRRDQMASFIGRALGLDPIDPPPPASTTTTSTTAPTEDCDTSYPDVCIPPPPPDLDCADVTPPFDFTVLPPDPHGFDADGNGVGCESG
jgi:hypothetical protein